MEKMTAEEALQLADEFVKSQPPSTRYTLQFDTIREFKGEYQVRYTKVFKEPTKESPPYLLVIVSPDGSVSWGLT